MMLYIIWIIIHKDMKVQVILIVVQAVLVVQAVQAAQVVQAAQDVVVEVLIKFMEKHVLQWHITHKCNLRCLHCYQEDYKQDLNFEEIRKVFFDYLDFLKKNKFILNIFSIFTR